ncbi:MAG: glycoside hydrolase family 16 protein [Actinomycetota bacterium]|nr:glycoside hydrolase family 16 protein [Actinomycetota bacterium]
MRRLKTLLLTVGMTGAAVMALASPANAVGYDSSFSGLVTPEFTNSGNQQVVLSGRVRPAVAGRTVSLYKVNADATLTWMQGSVTDAAGDFTMTATVSVITTFRFYSARQVVGADVYRGVTSDDFVVKSLRLWDPFEYGSVDQMQPKWALRSNHLDYGATGREHTKASWDAISFDGTGAAHFGLVPDGLGPDAQPRFKVPHISAGTLGIVHGHLEARIKFHRPQGAHGALWWHSGYGADGGEFDVAEFFGEAQAGTGGVESQRIQHTLHPTETSQILGNTWTGEPAGTDPVFEKNFAQGANGTWWNDYHTFSGYWSADQYVFFIDGKWIGHIPGPTATVPGEVLLSLLVSEKDSQEYEKLKARGNTSDYRMSVDWVRVWR